MERWEEMEAEDQSLPLPLPQLLDQPPCLRGWPPRCTCGLVPLRGSCHGQPEGWTGSDCRCDYLLRREAACKAAAAAALEVPPVGCYPEMQRHTPRRV